MSESDSQMERLFRVYSQKIIDFYAGSWVGSPSEYLGGAYTCQDDTINLMNIAFLQDYLKL